jgi:hypothetical protein
MIAACLATLEGFATKSRQDGIIAESQKQTTINSLSQVAAQLHSMLEVLKTTLW